jgi:SAM-dependent methyltransferase
MAIIADYPEAPRMSEEEYVIFHRKRVAMMRALLDKYITVDVKKVLDIGSGANVLGMGLFVKKRCDAEIHCIDLSDDFDRYIADGLFLHTVNVDLQPLPFPDGWFDLVLFASIIEHLYNPDFVIAECARVLKPGGLFLIEAPNAVSLGRRIDVVKGRNPFRFFNTYNSRAEKPPMFYCSIFYTVDEVQALLNPRFELLEWRYGRHIPPVSYWKRVIRYVALFFFPRMSDCFAIMARRNVSE